MAQLDIRLKRAYEQADAGDGFVDWEWLAAQPALSETSCVRHLRFERPLVVEMNGRRSEGVVMKA